MIVVYLYTTLTVIEAATGIDFSSVGGGWAPSDDQIYHAINDSFVSTAGNIINAYCDTTFSDYPDCPDEVTRVANSLVIRMILRRNSIRQTLGHSSVSDTYASYSEFGPQVYLIELSPEEKRLLDKQRTVSLEISSES